jgi:hypothetical protein
MWERHRSPRSLPYWDPTRAYDTRTGRRGPSEGGEPESGRLLGGRRGTEHVQGPVSVNDELTHRTRGPWYYAGNMRPPSEPIRWTDSGPVRLEMHMRTQQWRRWSGVFGQDLEGLHSGNPLVQTQNRNKGSRKRAQMRAPRQNRLTVQRYRGQSFSQTTQTLG